MTTDERIATRLADLTAKRAAIPDDDDLPARATRGELAAIQQKRADLDRAIAAIHTAVAAVASLGSAEADATWQDQLIIFRAVLVAELVQTPPRIRDREEIGRKRNLTLSISTIDHGPSVLKDSGYDIITLRLGELMRAAGYEAMGADPNSSYLGKMPWPGSLKDVERRLATLGKERARAESALEDALLSDADRAAQQAESKALNDASNSMRIIIGPDGKSLVAFRNQQDKENGVVYAVAEMTDLQRKAFTRDDAQFRAEQAARQSVNEKAVSI